MANIHRFTSYIRNSHIFTSVVDGFSLLNTIIINMRVRTVRMSFLPSFIMKFILTFSVKKIRIVFLNSLVKLITGISSDVSVKRIRLAMTLKQIMNFAGTAVRLKKVAISASVSLRLRITSISVAIKKIAIVANMTLARFNFLYQFDGLFLYNIDARTLVSLDYTVT